MLLTGALVNKISLGYRIWIFHSQSYFDLWDICAFDIMFSCAQNLHLSLCEMKIKSSTQHYRFGFKLFQTVLWVRGLNSSFLISLELVQRAWSSCPQPAEMLCLLFGTFLCEECRINRVNIMYLLILYNGLEHCRLPAQCSVLRWQ